MLSGVANLLFGTSSVEPEPEVKHVDVPTRDAELGWVVVDMPVSEKSTHEDENKQQRQQEEEEHGAMCPPSPHQCPFRVPVEIPEGDSSCPSDPESISSQPAPSLDCICSNSHLGSNVLGHNHTSTRVESWVLTPPPCFTGRRKKNTDVADSPMENLLIEHPSMSVYNSYGGDSTGEQSNQSESSSDVEMEVAVAHGTRQQTVHHAPRRPQAVAARAGIIAHVENVKYAQRKEQSQNFKKLSKKSIDRANRAKEYQAVGKHQRQRNRTLRPSGQMNGRVGQRKL